MKKRVLIADDEPMIRELLEDFLSADFEVMTAATGREAARAAIKFRPDAILLDVTMPDMDGNEALKVLRRDPELRTVPILMLTARGSSEDRIKSFETGADDYIQKPFTPEEVLARLHARLKRSEELVLPRTKTATISNLDIDYLKREVRIDGALLVLGPMEYGMLELFVRNPGVVITRARIMQRVWRDKGKNDRLIDAHLTSLRKKIRDFQGEIETVYGEGFRFKPAAGPGTQSG